MFRGMRDAPNTLYINGSKHEVRLNEGFNGWLYIMLHVIDQSEAWKQSGVPNKYRSIDIAGCGTSTELYGDQYIVIPFDNAVFGVAKHALGNSMPKLTKVFGNEKPPTASGGSLGPRFASYYHRGPNEPFSDPSPYYFTKYIFDYYEKHVGKFNFNETLECLNKLEQYITTNVSESFGDVSVKQTMNIIKRDMKKYGRSLIQVLDSYFEPAGNKIKALTYKGAREEFGEDGHSQSGFVAWTASEVLMVKKNHYNELKNTFNRIK